MEKNIVLCSDGTGNTTVKGRGTNVYKLYEAVDLEMRAGKAAQVVFYGDGVGTGSLKLLRVAGGAFGYGFARNVRDLYQDLCRVYEPGDRIYLFGFSRGAYTVRALAGLIGACGIVKGGELAEPQLRKAVSEAYGVYRLRFRPKRYDPDTDARTNAFRRRPDVHPPGDPVRIAFIGVWDTVGAVGLPDDAVSKQVLWVMSGYRIPWFRNYALSDIVDRACHALSIDDERQTFHPILWDEDRAPDGAPPMASAKLEQVWFAGVHTNVGGGYVKQGVSLVTLNWMMDRAEAAKLRFSTYDRALFRERQNVHDKLYDSRSGLAFSYRYSPRDIAAISKKAGIARPHIHATAFQRIGMRTEGYAPGNIPANVAVVDGTGVPVPAVQAEVQKALAAGLPLDSVSHLKRIRQVGYFTVLGCIALLAVVSLRVAFGNPDLAETAAALVSVSGLLGLLWQALYTYPVPIAILLAGVAAGWVASWAACRKMQDRFAEVWRPVAPNLRP